MLAHALNLSGESILSFDFWKGDVMAFKSIGRRRILFDTFKAEINLIIIVNPNNNL